MLDSYEQFLLNAAELRQEARMIITSNIANAHTPLYQARKLNFEEALSNRMDGVNMTSVSQSNAYNDSAHIKERRQSPVNTNTVNMNEERADFSQNMIHENFVLGLLKDHYRQMQFAITGQMS